MSEDFVVRLDRMYRELAELRASQPAAGRSAGESQAAAADGVGVAFGGAVEVAAARGRVTSVTMDPRVRRMAETELAEGLSAASSQALQQARAGAAVADVPEGSDLTALAEQLPAVQAQAARSVRLLTGGLAEGMAVISRRRAISGDPRLSELEQLLDDAGAALQAARDGGAEDGASAPVGGRGGDDTGLIGAEVDGSGLVVTLTMDPRAMRLASHEIADGVVTAVNAALAARERETAEQRGEGPGGATALTERLRQLQERGVAQMRSQVQSLTAIPASIQHR
jgi:DNA-binding protein YbaB